MFVLLDSLETGDITFLESNLYIQQWKLFFQLIFLTMFYLYVKDNSVSFTYKLSRLGYICGIQPA